MRDDEWGLPLFSVLFFSSSISLLLLPTDNDLAILSSSSSEPKVLPSAKRLGEKECHCSDQKIPRVCYFVCSNFICFPTSMWYVVKRQKRFFDWCANRPGDKHLLGDMTMIFILKPSKYFNMILMTMSLYLSIYVFISWRRNFFIKLKKKKKDTGCGKRAMFVPLDFCWSHDRVLS